MQIFRVTKPSCKILKTKNFVPFEVQYYSSGSNVIAKNSVPFEGLYYSIYFCWKTKLTSRWDGIVSHGNDAITHCHNKVSLLQERHNKSRPRPTRFVGRT